MTTHTASPPSDSIDFEALDLEAYRDSDIITKEEWDGLEPGDPVVYYPFDGAVVAGRYEGHHVMTNEVSTDDVNDRTETFNANRLMVYEVLDE